MPYYKPHSQSAFKHEHIFNQAVKHAGLKVIKAGVAVNCSVPPGGGSLAGEFMQLPQSSVPCAPDCTSHVAVKNTLKGDNIVLLTLRSLIPDGTGFFFFLRKEMFTKSIH